MFFSVLLNPQVTAFLFLTLWNTGKSKKLKKYMGETLCAKHLPKFFLAYNKPGPGSSSIV